MKSIDGKRMRELMEKKQACTIDVDPEMDFKKSHIKGSKNIPHNEKDFVRKVERQVSKKSENVVLCANQQLSSQLKKLGKDLEKAGFENVYQYQAGPSEWKSANLSIQKQA